MPRFIARLQRCIEQSCEVTVEAADADEAWDKAWDYLHHDEEEPDWKWDEVTNQQIGEVRNEKGEVVLRS